MYAYWSQRHQTRKQAFIITVMQVCSCDNCGFSYIHLGSAQFNLYNAKSQQQLPQVTF